MVDPIDAAVEALLMAQGTIRDCMQRAIDAYEAATIGREIAIVAQAMVVQVKAREMMAAAFPDGLPSEDAVSEARRRAQGRKLYGDEEFSLPNPTGLETAKNRPSVDVGKTWWEQADAGMRAAVLAHVPVKNEFVANLSAQYAERGLTGDEGGE